MKKFKSCIAIIALVIAMILCVGCDPKDPIVIKESDTFIVINVTSEQMTISGDTKLVDYMEMLKTKELLDFKIKDGMITEVNGIENPADWSSCWMIYTNDTATSNPAYSIEYNGKKYASANYGAESLVIKDGCTYIWYYQSF